MGRRPEASCLLRIACGEGRKMSNGLVFALIKKLQAQTKQFNASQIDELTFQHNLTLSQLSSNLKLLTSDRSCYHGYVSVL